MYTIISEYNVLQWRLPLLFCDNGICFYHLLLSYYHSDIAITDQTITKMFRQYYYLLWHLLLLFVSQKFSTNLTVTDHWSDYTLSQWHLLLNLSSTGLTVKKEKHLYYIVFILSYYSDIYHTTIVWLWHL